MQTTIHPLFPHPALLLKDDNKKYLIISDLHIGFEEKFRALGINLEIRIKEMQQELNFLIKQIKPNRLIILGDLKNSIKRINNFEWKYVPLFLEKINSKTKVIFIKGNHDGGISPLLPKRIEFIQENTLSIKENVLLHGHTLVNYQRKNINRLIIGHIHPVYKRIGNPLTGKQVWLMLDIKKPYPSKDDFNLIIIPSFNQELNKLGFGRPSGKIISPLINRLKNKVKDAKIITLNGDIIGGINSIEYII